MPWLNRKNTPYLDRGKQLGRLGHGEHAQRRQDLQLNRVSNWRRWTVRRAFRHSPRRNACS